MHFEPSPSTSAGGGSAERGPAAAAEWADRGTRPARVARAGTRTPSASSGSATRSSIARRPAADAPVRTWARRCSPPAGSASRDRVGDTWLPWVADLPGNDRRPGDPGADGRELTLVDLVTQAWGLIGRYFGSFPSTAPRSADRCGRWPGALRRRCAGGDGRRRRPEAAPDRPVTRPVSSAILLRHEWSPGSDDTLRRTRYGVALAIAADPRDRRRRTADPPPRPRRHQRRGVPGLAGSARRARRSWPTSRSSAAIYDMVFGFVGGDTRRPSLGAGTAVLFGGKTLFDYKGSIFWKMAAGMGDIVFAPLYEALRKRGVSSSSSIGWTRLHPSEDGTADRGDHHGPPSPSRPRPGRTYDPLVLCRGLPCFPSRPRVDQLAEADGIENHPARVPLVRVAGCRDAESCATDRTSISSSSPSRRGWPRYTCTELAAERLEWRDMLEGLSTVATQSFQLWLRDSPRLTSAGRIRARR